MQPIFALPIYYLLIEPVWAFCGTSFNVVFFYMTWATLVLSHSALRVELVGTATVRVLCYALPSLLFFLFDILTPSAAVLLKAQGEYGLPAGNKRGRIRKKDLKVAGWALFNLTLGIVVQAAVEHALASQFRKVRLVKVTLKLPLPWTLVLDLFWGLLFREILSYTIHRCILHTNNPLARLHRTWYHSLRAPYPLTAHYDHPLVYLVGRWLPTILPVFLRRLHMLSYIVYLGLVSLEETFAYSGYSPMPTGFFIGGMARNTEAHLHSAGKGNFGPWGVLDWMLSTNVEEEFEEADGEVPSPPRKLRKRPNSGKEGEVRRRRTAAAGVVDLKYDPREDYEGEEGEGESEDREEAVAIVASDKQPIRRMKHYWTGEPKTTRDRRTTRRRAAKVAVVE